MTGSADLLIRDAMLVTTVDDDRTELAGGWVAVSDGLISGVGEAGDEPDAGRTLDATGCLVTPGLINTHHHIYQNLTRAYRPALDGNLFHWLRTLYPLWARLDEEAAYVSAWVGLAELAVSGCTTSTDHLYVHTAGGGDLIDQYSDRGPESGPDRGVHACAVPAVTSRHPVPDSVPQSQSGISRSDAPKWRTRVSESESWPRSGPDGRIAGPVTSGRYQSGSKALNARYFQPRA